jgi:hypothetical protein
MNARDLDPFGPDSYPDVVKLSAEHRELRRIASARILERKGVDPHTRAWAEAWASIQPLGQPLSDGQPKANHGTT